MKNSMYIVKIVFWFVYIWATIRCVKVYEKVVDKELENWMR